ncbi:MAG: lipopolysaccharide transport periplasmic protein LptA [Deltaproteobacteria bacterium]|nr:lipopolysaccharide transport periplasmic protein LptA [Deltaproteobacteria bacterium]MBW2121895.1 lipopolysaccharide transport periplasmic protein LptA [Deltaproteobacteria bacterium]
MGKGLSTVCWLTLAGWLAFGLMGPWVLAEQKEKGPGGLDLKVRTEPITVSSGTLVWEHKAHKATFHEDVVARQQDLEIRSDSLTIYFNQTDSDITRLVAEGNVKILQMDRRAFCEKAVYDRTQERIVLEGNPVIRQGQNEIRGQRVIYFVRENRSVVEGGQGGRVRVTLVPEKGKVPD